ncbi:MAG: Gfo/Idh/MocA family oxidoreductase [Pirellulales bacterium]|nr:Gfo/Idh/MocA family oxidoreductase [Pirellulales bacterium]
MTIRVGIAGLGFMGMIHYTAYRKVRGAKVVALCELDPRRRAGDWRGIKGNFGPPGRRMDLSALAAYADWRELAADPDVDLIDVCLPPALHAPVTLGALQAGKHVFCEKPIALAAADAAKMIAAARQSRRRLLIGHVLPFFPEYRFAYRAIVSGKYGKLLGGHFKRIISDPAWLPDYYHPDKVGGPMLDLHVHDAHFIRLTCGMPRRVRSVGTLRGEVVERFSTQFLFDDPRLIVTAAGGVIAQQGRPFTHGYEIYLEGATLLFNFATIGKGLNAHTPPTVLLSDGRVQRPTVGGDPLDAFVAEIREVVRTVGRGAPSTVLDARLARDALILCRKQTESVRRGRAVEI